MAESASSCLFLALLSILSLTISSSGTPVGFSYSARGEIATSSGAVISSLKINKASGVSVDLYLNESLVESLLNSESAAVSWLKNHVENFPPHVNIRSIILTCSSENFSGKDFLSKLKSFHSVLSGIHLDIKVKVSVAFSLSFLENLGTTHDRELQGILDFVKKTRSFAIIEACIDKQLTPGDVFVQSLIKKANLATSNLASKGVRVMFTMKSPIVSRAGYVTEFITKVSKSLKNIHIRSQIAELYAEVSSLEDFPKGEQIFLSRRQLLNSLKTTLHDTFNPPTIFPTPPISTTPVTIPPDFPTPTIVTVPATNPVTITPTNPDATPLPIPSTTPVNIPPVAPVNPPAPVTNPVTTPTPITNPVTTYPAPAGNVPVTTPVTSPVTPPAQTNAPAIPGQSWCVARTGAPETSLQSALDYACGMGGADCSTIQQGGSCYNPNTLQNHASYAFNSYYQKNPTATSCDFGGTAVIVNTNPSSGSCIYPSSASASTSTTPTTPTSTPTVTAPPATTTVSPTLPGVPGAVTPPTVLNSSSPTSVFGSDSPPVVNTSASTSAGLQPFMGCFTLVASFVTGTIILHV